MVEHIWIDYDREADVLYSSFRKKLKKQLKTDNDIFWTKSSIGKDTINLWLETYQMTRDLVKD